MTKLYEEMRIQREKHMARLINSSSHYIGAYDRASKAVLEGEPVHAAIDRLCPIESEYTSDEEQGTVAGALQAARLVRLQKEGKL